MALPDNRNPTSRELSLEDNVLKTNGALVSIQAPPGWSASITSKKTQPGLPPETFFILSKSENSKTSIGIYFSGIIYDEVDGRLRKEQLFDTDLNMKAGSTEASRPVGGEGALAGISQICHALLAAGDHAVQFDEKHCRAVKSTQFNGMKSVIFEFENNRTGTKTFEYCIDILGNGQVVYSLYYRAAIDDFSEDIDTAIKTFQSSVWRKDFDPMLPLDAVD